MSRNLILWNTAKVAFFFFTAVGLNSVQAQTHHTRNTVLVWNNAADTSVWDSSDRNWYDNYVSKGNDAFLTDDTVIFNSDGSHTVLLPWTVSVSKDNRFRTGERGVRVSGTGNWTFEGGAIADNYDTVSGLTGGPDFLATLVFDGSGTLTLNNTSANQYHGGNEISGGGTVIAARADSLGTGNAAGQKNRNVVVQKDGYGIDFVNQGGTVRFQSGTANKSGILDQRIGVGKGTAGELIYAGAERQLVVTVNGSYQTNFRDLNGGAVNVAAGGSILIDGTFAFTDNHTTGNGKGGAVFADTGTEITIKDASFLANSAANGDGGAIYVGNGVKLTANDSVFASNISQSGGAVLISGDAALAGEAGLGALHIENTVFQGNRATLGNGGAVNAVNTKIFGSGASFTPVGKGSVGNTAVQSGGAVYVFVDNSIAAGHTLRTVELNQTVFRGNTAETGSGGAVVLDFDNAVLNIAEANFSGNTAALEGGAVTVRNKVNINADLSVFQKNTSGLAGGAVSAGSGAVISAKSGTFTDNTAKFAGGAIYGADNSAADVSGTTALLSVFSGNQSVNGGAVFLGNNAEITANNTQFKGNSAATLTEGAAVFYGTGGAVFTGNHAVLTAQNSKFLQNQSGEAGGAVFMGEDAKIDVSGSVFSSNIVNGNYTDGYGGAVFAARNAKLTLTDSEFLNNKVGGTNGSGGAVYVNEGAAVSAGGTKFQNNSASQSGGAVYLSSDKTSSSALTAKDSQFVGNKAVNGFGGAIATLEYSTVDVSGSQFNSNASGTYGGAVYAFRADVNADNTGFTNNKTNDYGGAVFVQGVAGDLCVVGFDGATFQGNAAGQGSGGAVFAEYTQLTGSPASFVNNTASIDGGAVFYGIGVQTANFKETVFTGNKAGQSGGAVYFTGTTLNTQNASFQNNQAGNGGGALFLSAAATLNAENTGFTNNKTTQGNGGAIAAAGGKINAAGALFKGNEAQNGFGGAVFVQDTDLNLYDARFENNKAGQFGGAITVFADTKDIQVQLGAASGSVAGFSGNKAGSGLQTSSIHFIGNKAVTMNIVAASEGRFELLDSMSFDTAENKTALSIAKSGKGTWVLGSVHQLGNAATGVKVNVQDGTLEMLSGAKLLTIGAVGNDIFATKKGTELLAAGQNEIAASTIDIQGRISFDLDTTPPGSTGVSLVLTSPNIVTAIGSQEINIVEFAGQVGKYNLIHAEGTKIVDTGKLFYKGSAVETLSRLDNAWSINADNKNSMLQLVITETGNTSVTWTGNKNHLWNVEDRNWTGKINETTVSQFLDNDTVLFGNNGAGAVNVNPNNVVVNTMTVDSAKDYTFQGGTVSGKTLTKKGTGVLELNTLFVFDNVFIQKGTLSGGQTNSVSNKNIRGNLQMDTGTLLNPSGTFTVDGNVSFKSGAALKFLTGTKNTYGDKLTATGSIRFADGQAGTVKIQIDGGGLQSGEYLPGEALINADGGLTINGTKIEDGIYGRKDKKLIIAAGDRSVAFNSDRSLVLQAIHIEGDSTAMFLEAFGTGFGANGPTKDEFTDYQLAIYNALENADYLSAGNDFFVELAKIQNVADKAEVLDSLVSTVNAAAAAVTERNILRVSSAAFDRLRYLNERPCNPAGYTPLVTRGQEGRFKHYRGLMPWFDQFGDFTKQQNTSNAVGYKADSYAFVAGLDKWLNRDTAVGIGLGGSFASVNSGLNQSGKANSFLAVFYSSYRYDGWTVSADLGGASSEYLFKKHLFNTASEDKLSGSSFFGGLELSRKYCTDIVNITPFASLNLVTLNIDAYNDGLGALRVETEDSVAVLQTLGARLSQSYQTACGAQWTPGFDIGWIHDYGDSEIKSTSVYGGMVPFTIAGAAKNRDRMNLGGNLNVAFRRLNLFGAYNAEFASRYASHTIQGGFSFLF